jgi:RNA polymerase sigma-70 factor (ECF subfamily)
MFEPSTDSLQCLLERMNCGDVSARNDLIRYVERRLWRLATKMFQDYVRLGRWEDVEDVLQNALVRLLQALERVKPASVAEFFRLATRNIRWELLDLARHHFGPEGLGRNHATKAPGGNSDASAPLHADEPGNSTFEPSRLAEWAEFHERVKNLPEKEQDVFDLLWYQGLSQAEAASVLKVSIPTIKRYWMAARLRLQDALIGKED